jgi:hypothetical protein
MINIDFLDLITIGKINQIALGFSRGEIENILGKPEMKGGSTRKYPNPVIWKYGDIEFIFNNKEDELIMIIFNFNKEINQKVIENSNIKIIPSIIKKGLSFEDFTEFIKNNKIPFKEIDPPVNEGCRECLVNNNVLFIFNYDKNIYGEHSGLAKIIYSEKCYEPN